MLINACFYISNVSADFPLPIRLVECLMLEHQENLTNLLSQPRCMSNMAGMKLTHSMLLFHKACYVF